MGSQGGAVMFQYETTPPLYEVPWDTETILVPESQVATSRAGEDDGLSGGVRVLSSRPSDSVAALAAPAVTVSLGEDADFISFDGIFGKKPPPVNRTPDVARVERRSSAVAEEEVEEVKKAAYSPPPWARARSGRRIRSPLLRLHEDIVDFVSFLEPTPDEKAGREAAVERVTSVILSIWPTCEPRVFGSFATGLFLPTSDVDIVVLNSGLQLPTQGLRALATALSRRQVAKSIQVIGKARVPIIKFVEARSNIRFDVSFDVSNGPEAAAFICQAIEALPPLRPLCLVVKIYLQQRELNEVYTGGIGSYALLVMLMAHLQLHPSRRSYSSGGAKAPLESNLGALLLDFFELYGRSLNMRDVGVSCRAGGSFYSKRVRGMGNSERPWLLSVEDPQQPDNDIGRNSFMIAKVRSAFMHAHSLLTSNTEADHGPDGLLDRIVRLDEVLMTRKGAADLAAGDEPCPSTSISGRSTQGWEESGRKRRRGSKGCGPRGVSSRSRVQAVDEQEGTELLYRQEESVEDVAGDEVEEEDGEEDEEEEEGELHNGGEDESEEEEEEEEDEEEEKAQWWTNSGLQSKGTRRRAETLSRAGKGLASRLRGRHAKDDVLEEGHGGGAWESLESHIRRQAKATLKHERKKIKYD